MKNWQMCLVMPKATLRHTMKVISDASTQLALVVEPGNKLLGTVSDGDIRNALLNNADLENSIETLMNVSPTVALLGTSKAELITMMTTKSIRQIPIVDSNNILHGLELLEENLRSTKRDNPVVLMAGGLGNRLRPLTEECPKPLLKIHGRPILEWIISGYIQAGFHKFYLSINYKGDMIKEYFQNGSKWGVSIDYLEEEERLGTAGALSLMKEVPTLPFFVMNGDLITQVNFSHLMDFHESRGNCATMCAQDYSIEVPYGIIETSGMNIQKIVEKPKYNFLINSGIYVFSPEVFQHIPNRQYFDIPSLFEKLIEDKKTVQYFPVNGYWLDIGRKEDLERAHEDIERQLMSMNSPLGILPTISPN